MTRHKSSTQLNTQSRYDRFHELNGSHPIMDAVPDLYVNYKARTRHKGKVAYFNYNLGSDMGLIANNHARTLNPELEKELLHTFGLFIINEYDNIHQVKYPENEIRPNHYMATRYLQLQHPSKTGKTSGDGRSIWNGTISHHGTRFDVSCRGTGATCLSPATSLKKRFFQNGDPSISYGCGLCDLDEAIEAAFFSEILHQNGIRTERTLAVLEYPGKLAVVVRAYPNLLRPSHFFRYLKQGNYQGLKSLFEYHFAREQENGNLPKGNFSDQEKYRFFLDKVALDFAGVTASFEDEYIFCWLDWDGDNILMDGGIIDYGSVRQFGLFHHEYRYDDVERFSTSITEQKHKARYIVQNFAQMIDFLKSKKKKNLHKFFHHPILKKFDQAFLACKDQNLLKKIGLRREMAKAVFEKHRPLISQFRKEFSYFERVKSKQGIYKVPDGITCDAVFCMRDILRELPQVLLCKGKTLLPQEFIDVARSQYASKKDVEINATRRQHVLRFQDLYRQIIHRAAILNNGEDEKLLLEVCMRSSVINKYDRVTGNSVTIIVQKLIQQRPKLKADQIYQLLQDFVGHQLLDPEKRRKKDEHAIGPKRQKQMTSLMNGLFKIVRDFRESI